MMPPRYNGNQHFHSRRLHAQDLSRYFSSVFFAGSVAAPLIAQGAPAQGTADQPYTIEYYYKVQWGHQQEFHDLFLKNHYPLLKKIAVDRAHAVREDRDTGLSRHRRWALGLSRDDRFKNSTVATTANPDEEALIKQLWPDQETYKKEEQRRFEILASHWDLPVTDITPKK